MLKTIAYNNLNLTILNSSLVNLLYSIGWITKLLTNSSWSTQHLNTYSDSPTPELSAVDHILITTANFINIEKNVRVYVKNRRKIVLDLVILYKT